MNLPGLRRRVMRIFRSSCSARSSRILQTADYSGFDLIEKSHRSAGAAVRCRLVLSMAPVSAMSGCRQDDEIGHPRAPRRRHRSVSASGSGLRSGSTQLASRKMNAVSGLTRLWRLAARCKPWSSQLYPKRQFRFIPPSANHGLVTSRFAGTRSGEEDARWNLSCSVSRLRLCSA